LFDYETNNLVKSVGTAAGSAELIRLGDKCQFCGQTPPAAAEPLLLLNERNGSSHIGEFAIRPAAETLWLVIRDLPDKTGYRLTEGDVLRVGRLVYRVKQLSMDGKMPLALPSATVASEVEVYKPDGAQPLACRICLSDSQTPENPLISPCNCSGTMKFIHLECLQEWLKSRLNIKQSGSAMSYFWHTLDCELCKEDFPTTIQVSGTLRELVEVHKPDTPFIVLEENKRDSSRGLHVVSMAEGNCFRMGRGHDCDIRVADISVSRVHATIKLNHGEFYLEDKNSKFGTLVQIKQPLPLSIGVPISVQVTRTVITLKLKRPWRLLQCCSCFPRSRRVAHFPASNAHVSPYPEYQADEDACQPRDAIENTEQVREVTDMRDATINPRLHDSEEEKCEERRPLPSPNS